MLLLQVHLLHRWWDNVMYPPTNFCLWHSITINNRENRPNPFPIHVTNNTSGGISIDANHTKITQVQSAITTTIPNWPQTKAMNTSLPETTLIVFSVTPSIVILIIPSIVLTLSLIMTYRCIERKKSKSLKQGDSNIRIKDTKVIWIGMDVQHVQHVCARVSSDAMVYNGQYTLWCCQPWA